MVSAGTIVVIAGAAILFFAVGGIEGLRGIGTGLRDTVSGFGSIPSAQAETSTKSEKDAIASDSVAPAQALSITSSRKNAGTLQSTVRVSSFQPELQTEIARSAQQGSVRFERGGTLLLDTPTEKLRRTLTGRGTAQFSTGQVGVLTEAKRQEIRNRALTAQERRDVAALEARRARKIERGIRPNIALRGAELVLRKREQEELSKSLVTSRFGGSAFVNGKLFANPDFFFRTKSGELI